MKHIFRTLIVVMLAIGSLSALSKTSQVDAFQLCLNRTKTDRLNCEAGCGMIIQQCYEEGIDNENAKMQTLLADLKTKNGNACADFAKTYLDDAKQMENDLTQKADSFTGWVGSEMRLNFAKQRVDTIKLIRETCKE